MFSARDPQFLEAEDYRKWDWGEGDDVEIGPYKCPENWWARVTLNWVQHHLRCNTFQRGDYTELCELMNLILGGQVSISRVK